MCHNFPKSKFRLSLASAAPRTPVLLGQGFFGLKVETWQLMGWMVVKSCTILDESRRKSWDKLPAQRFHLVKIGFTIHRSGRLLIRSCALLEFAVDPSLCNGIHVVSLRGDGDLWGMNISFGY
jgi:hypothetical protein